MENILLYSKLKELPENLKLEVFNFIEFLLSKSKISKELVSPKFGSGKGMFIMNDDFD